MSKADNKKIIINVKDLILFSKEQYADDLLRFFVEQLPQVQVGRDGNEIEMFKPRNLTKKAIKLRIKKFLHQKNLVSEFRPILYRTHDLEGFIIKKRKMLEVSYY